MAVVSRDPDPKQPHTPSYYRCAADISAASQPQNNNPVIPRDYTTYSNSKGEKTMEFLKNFLIEEDGQDLVEYGLVIAGLVLAGTAAITIYTGGLGNAMSALGSRVTSAL